jgi:hypothetical protein
MKFYKVSIFVMCAFVLISFVFGYGYKYIYSKTVTGELTSVEKLVDGGIISTQNVAFSFAVAIKTNEGVITSSSEDRQWAVTKAGMCVEAKLFPYPPWEFEKAGTYHGARLLRVINCVQ